MLESTIYNRDRDIIFLKVKLKGETLDLKNELLFLILSNMMKDNNACTTIFLFLFSSFKWKQALLSL